MKVGGVNITARYKCGFKRLVGCASRVSRMVFTSVWGVYHPLTSWKMAAAREALPLAKQVEARAALAAAVKKDTAAALVAAIALAEAAGLPQEEMAAAREALPLAKQVEARAALLKGDAPTGEGNEQRRSRKQLPTGGQKRSSDDCDSIGREMKMMRAREGHGYLMREGLMLFLSDNKAGFWGVRPNRKAYQAFVQRDGKAVGLGTFDTPEEAAMCVARSPEGRARAAATMGKAGDGKIEIAEEGVVCAVRCAGPVHGSRPNLDY